jgi:hypothetical protein
VVMGEISFEKRDSLLAPCTSIFPLPVFFVLMCTRSWNPSPFKSARVQTPSSSREKTVGIGLAAKSLLRRCKAVGKVSIPSWSSCSILLIEVLRSSNRAALSSLRCVRLSFPFCPSPRGRQVEPENRIGVQITFQKAAARVRGRPLRSSTLPATLPWASSER